MPWTTGQIRAAAMAARAAGWLDPQRRMVLSSLGDRAVHGGQITSKSPRLNQGDFEQYMATAEADAAPGNGGALPGFSPGYWHGKCRDTIQRQRHAILKLAEDLNLPGVGGMIHRATGGRASSLEDLDQLNDRAVAGKVLDLLRDKSKHTSRRHEAIPAEAIPFERI